MFMQKWYLYSHRPFNLTFGHSQNFKEFFAYMWLEMWDNLHNSNARWLAYYKFAHFSMTICGDAQLFESILSSESHKPSAHFPAKFDWSKHGIFSCITSFDCYNLKIPKVIHAHFCSHYSSYTVFQDPTNKSHFSLKTCS